MFFDFATQAKIVQSMTELTLSNYVATSKAVSNTMETALDSFSPQKKSKRKTPKKGGNSKKSKSNNLTKKAGFAAPSPDLMLTAALAPYKFYANSLASLQPVVNGWSATLENMWNLKSGSNPIWAPPQWAFANPFERQRSVWEQLFDPFEIWTRPESPPFPFWPTNRSPYNNAFTYSSTANQLDDMQRMLFVFATPPFVQKFGAATPWLNLWA